MLRDELVKLLLTFDNLPIKINADFVTYDVEEIGIYQCTDAIMILLD